MRIFPSIHARAGLIGFWLPIFVLGLLWLTASRVLLTGLHLPRLNGAGEMVQLFLTGLRMDVVTLCYLLALPILCDFLLPGQRWRGRLVKGLLGLAAFTLLYMEMATPSFIDEFDHRPDRLFFEYLSHPREVFGTLLREHGAFFILGSAATILLTGLFLRHIERSRLNFDGWSWGRRALVFPAVLVLVFLGARGTLGHRPVNISTATFGNNHIANELALNSSYSLAYAVYATRQEVDVAHLYGNMGWDEALTRVRRYMDVPAGSFNSGAIPTLHQRAARAGISGRRPNIVIFAQESLGAGFVGALGGLPLTPNLDRLRAEGLWFSDLYATGTRTVRGLEALTTGFPPTTAPSVLKLPNAQRGFFTAAQLLAQQGYATEFIYGGVSNFDNMGGFFLANGFQRVIEQKDFSNPAFMGTWGASDEDLVVKANETFKAHGEQPFFAVMLSTSNHQPFEYPEGRIEPYEQPAGTRNNAVKYADYAVGKLFELAKKEDYYRNTIFLVVADHDAHVFGESLVPVSHFHIPALIIGPGVPRGTYERTASQMDLLPTLLGLAGITAETPMIGRDLMTLATDEPGRALMQYGNAYGLRVGNKVAVLQPREAARSFVWDGKTLLPAPADPELERDALAHMIWAAQTYQRRLYALDTSRQLAETAVTPRRQLQP